MYRLLIITTIFCLSLQPFKAQNNYNYPVVEKDHITDDYFGYPVEDPFRWLEDDRSDRTEQWVKQENLVTEKYLRRISYRPKIKMRLTELWNFNKQSAPFKKGNSFFCYKNDGLQDQSVLYIKKSIEDNGEILLDPNTLSTDGTVSLSGTSISKNGKTLAYGISKAGSDWVEIHFKDIVTKKDESIKSTLAGTVIYSGWTSESGYMIQIQHNNDIVSVYKHNSVVLKNEGERVNAGQVIAIVGNSGEITTGPHLHFEIWHKGTAIDPQDYISF
jgi:murein DD-endopeptidase MepM/ murein hydrolase activator NlpD